MSLLGDILLGYLAAPSNYADEALAAAVERLEKAYDEHPALVFQTELAMLEAMRVGIPYDKVDEFRRLHAELGEK